MNKFILFASFIFLSSFSKAQDSASVRVSILQYGKSYITNTGNMFLAPGKWNRQECKSATLIMATGVVLYFNDKRIQEFIQKNKTNSLDNASHYVFERFGSAKYVFPLLGAFYLHGAVFGKQRSRKTAALGIQAFLLSGLATNIGKYSLQRHRPYHDDPSDPSRFEGPFKGYSGYNSLPSGHTTSAFAVAAVIASEYNRTPLVPILCYSMATLTGFSRVYDNKHWFSDILIGGAIGYAVGKLVHTKNPWNKKKQVKRFL